MTTQNVNVTVNEQFFMELGKLVAKYFGITPDNVEKVDLTIPTGNGDDDQTPPAPVAVKVNHIREYGKEGLPENPSCYNYEEMETLRRILTRHPEIELNDTGKARKGALGCVKTAELIIHRFDPEGKLVDEALGILVDAKQHLEGQGITRNKLELVTRILALHQGRGRNKVKEILTEIMTEQTINSLLVLAKETKLYTQRSNIDMLTMFVEARIAEKADGVRNQFELVA